MADQKFNPYKNDFINTFKPNFRVILVGTFKTMDDFVGIDFISKL